MAQYSRGNATSQPSPAELIDAHLLNLKANHASSSPEALFDAHLDLAARLALIVNKDFDVVKRCVAPICEFVHWHVPCNCVRSPSRLFAAPKGAS
jgi:hypothetical protein